MVRIEEGKFYRDREGRKIGPMHSRVCGRSEYTWIAKDITDAPHTRIYKPNGENYDNGPMNLVAEWVDAPKKFKLEEGKFYKTADGVIVGPMSIWSNDVEHPFEQKNGSTTFSDDGDLWRKDGTSRYCPSLVAEVDEPAVTVSDEIDRLRGALEQARAIIDAVLSKEPA